MSDCVNLAAVVNANVETVDQGLAFLAALPLEVYIARREPISSSTIGEHMRHVVDMYHALLNGRPAMNVDFNFRRRGAPLETDPACAERELESIKRQLQSLINCENSPVQITTEVALGESRCVSINSSLARELVFTSSHAVHHYALMAVIAKLHGVMIDANLGMAAATASYQRGLAANG